MRNEKDWVDGEEWHRDHPDDEGPCPDGSCDSCGTYFMGEDW